jgi:DNA-binding MarR family transcriptional regulator
MRKKLQVIAGEPNAPIAERVSVGLQKIGLAMKHEAWSRANEDGLSPTQAQILSLLALEGARTGSELAQRLGVTLPTVSDSARVLVERGLLEKSRDPRHPRASLLGLTETGRALAARVARWPDFLASAVSKLTSAEQEVFLTGITKMIVALQGEGLVPTSRMCVSCAYFRPHVHEGETPHHCAYVDAPMASRDLRMDCAEHEEAEAADRARTFARFVSA